MYQLLDYHKEFRYHGLVAPPRSSSKEPLAAEVWRLLGESFQKQFKDAASILQESGLTPGHLRVLMLLSSGEAMPMGSLAQGLSCDASTMTWLIDRLEERGLVERKGLPSDRRVKTVVLTTMGLKTTGVVKKRLYKPPPELLELDEETLTILRDVFSTSTPEDETATASATS
jgi:DNA-binding MarR family transcriptional regulator